MDKSAVLAFLDAQHISYRVVNHKAVFTIEEMEALHLPDAQCVAKNLFLRDDKKRHYYLIVIQENKRVNLKELRTKLGSRPLTFASENDLAKIMGLIRGAVTPFGIFNDQDCLVDVYIDTTFANSTIAIHPNDNTASVWLNTNELASIIKEHGNHVKFLEL